MKTTRDKAQDVLIGVCGLPHPSDPNYGVLVTAIEDAITYTEREAWNAAMAAAVAIVEASTQKIWVSSDEQCDSICAKLNALTK